MCTELAHKTLTDWISAKAISPSQQKTAHACTE